VRKTKDERTDKDRERKEKNCRKEEETENNKADLTALVMIFIYVFKESRDSSVGVMTRILAGQPRDSGSIPSSGRSVQCPSQPTEPCVQLILEDYSWGNVTQDLD
jgi:hypothetical protein